jgi:hypothetical protein
MNTNNTPITQGLDREMMLGKIFNNQARAFRDYQQAKVTGDAELINQAQQRYHDAAILAQRANTLSTDDLRALPEAAL